MSTKMATNGPHSAGIFADMTVDGPEIGTLVLVVDRGKNLPNRKTMGKQNPYCAARLGKEARKTEVDKRGGQTPRWDQELRFTVHDSPDYYKLKISVFNEDKKTDLIGEAWIELDNIIIPGGGKGDLWQGLTCKGKYAGELRVELTYYDSREKPETKQETISMADELRQQYGTLHPKVKRRPLPTNPHAPSTTDVVIPDRPAPGRARHGPRDFQVAARMASAPTAKTFNYPQSEATLFGQKGVQALSQGNSPAPQSNTPHPPPEPTAHQHYEEYEHNPEPEVYDPYAQAPAQADFLPQLGPSSRQRGPMPPQPRYQQQRPRPQQHAQSLPRPMSHIGIPHSHSAPVVPVAHQNEPHAYDDSYSLRTDYPEPIPDVDYQYQQVALSRQRRNDVPPGWQDEYQATHSDHQPYIEEDLDSSLPPPPPMHSNSAPAIPHYQGRQSQSPMPRYGTTPPSSRQQYLPNQSPMQSIERDLGPQQTPPSHERSRRGQSFHDYGSHSPYQGSHQSTPNLSSPVSQQSPSPYAQTSPYGRQGPGRNSFTDPYGTPSRQPHPLSHEVPRARSPHPYGTPERQVNYNHYDRGRDNSVPLIKPRAISPAPSPASPQVGSASRNAYSLQFPVRAFESSDSSPLSTSVKAKVNSLPRKSVSPRPSFSGGNSSATPFSPDDFGAHNPAVPAAEARSPKGPIVGWHGQEIDPSDHLPVDSWAPEPEKKTPTKTYGLGREKEFGPRSLSKDTVINVRMKPGSNIPEQQAKPSASSKIRGVLKKAAPKQPRYASEPPREVPRNYDSYNSVPDPYGQQHFSRSFHESSHESSPGGHGGPPSLPPKVPLSHSPGMYSEDALSREISSIDIGGSRARTSGAAFVPVRSHRDRNSYY